MRSHKILRGDGIASRQNIERLEKRILLCGVDPVRAELPGHPHADSAIASTALPVLSSSGISASGVSSLTVPGLSSRPSATQKLYLDFDGQTQIRWGSWAGLGGSLTGMTNAFDTDGDPLSYSETERDQIGQIWSIVTEKFSVFDLDVTTFDPSALNDGRAAKIVIGGNGVWYGSGGGVAYRGGFNGGTLDNDNIGWVWDGQGGGGDIRYIGEAVAHEAGHLFGLQHQSLVYGDWVGTEYRNQFIMGRGDAGLAGGRWGRGEASHRDWFDGSLDYGGMQDDIPGMIAGGLHLRGDDHGGTLASATAMSAVPIGFQGQGVIHAAGDQDVFRFTPPAGRALKIRLTVNGLAPMLNPAMQLFDSGGALLATADSGTVFREVYGEEIDLASTSGSYYVKVYQGQAPSIFDNVGMYTVTIDTAGTQDNSWATARAIHEFGSSGSEQRLWGRSIFSDVVNSADGEDWYRFYMTYGSSLTATLTGLSGNADLYLYRARDVVDLTENLIASSTNGGATSESLSRPYEVYSVPYYIRVVHAGGAAANYALTLTVDSARPGDSTSMRTFAIAEPEVGMSGRHGDFVGFGDRDNFFFVSRFASARTEVSLQLEAMTAPVRFEWGYEFSGSGLADADVIGSTVVVPGVPQSLLHQQMIRTTGRVFMLRAREEGITPSNYRITAAYDHAPIPTIDADDLTPAGPLSDYGVSLHGVALRDAVDKDDPLDAYDLGVVAPGQLTIAAEMLDPQSPSHRWELIRDVNGNRMVDQGEIVASGPTISYFVPAASKDRFFLRVLADPQTNSSGPFVLRFADGVINDPAGRDFDKPRFVQLGNTGTLSGYVGLFQDEPALTRHIDYFAFEVDKTEQFTAMLAQQSDDIGLQILRDFNNNGELDPDERLLGAGLGGAAPKVIATLLPGTYFLAVVAAAPHHDVRDVVSDYSVSYSFQPASDTTAVQLVGGSLLFQTRDAFGLKIVLSEDAQMTLGAGDVLIERLDGVAVGNGALAAGQTLIQPLGQVYDPATATLGLVLPASLADGNYRVTLRAGSIADPFGNRLEADAFFDFFVLTGDANHDRHVDQADLAILNANFGNTGQTFDQGDFNYDGTVDDLDRDLLDANWLLWLPPQGTAVVLAATSGADAYQLNLEGSSRLAISSGVGATAAMLYRLPPGVVSGMTFDGGDGADTLLLVGAPGVGDHFMFGTSSVTFASFSVVHSQVETIALEGAGSGDSVRLLSGAVVRLLGTHDLQSLQIDAGALGSLPVGGGGTLTTRALSVGGRLDLADNQMFLRYTGPSPIGTPTGSTYSGITGLIQSAYHGRAWDGNGITTSMAAASSGLTTLGIAEAAGVLGLTGTQTALWRGQTVDATTLLVRYTYGGDANLDGFISADDYARIDFAIAAPGSFGYVNGDFNYDGIISADDYTVIDFNIAAQGPPIGSPAGAQSEPRAASTAIAEAQWASPIAKVSPRLQAGNVLRPSRNAFLAKLIEPTDGETEHELI